MLKYCDHPGAPQVEGECKSLFLSLGPARAGFLWVVIKGLWTWGYGVGGKSCARKSWMQNKGLTARQERRLTTGTENTEEVTGNAAGAKNQPRITRISRMGYVGIGPSGRIYWDSICYFRGSWQWSEATTDMALKRMDNVLIVVEDLEAVKAFFIELGLKLEGETMVEGPVVGKLTGLKDVRATLAMLRTPDGQGIELDKFHTPGAIRFGPVDAPVNTLGIRRVMFAVDDIDDGTDAPARGEVDWGNGIWGRVPAGVHPGAGGHHCCACRAGRDRGREQWSSKP